jgi:hypothetical protein
MGARVDFVCCEYFVDDAHGWAQFNLGVSETLDEDRQLTQSPG